MVEFHDTQEVYTGQTSRYCWRIVGKERVDGNETTPYTSIERCELGKTPDGQYVPVLGRTKSVTLPSNPEMLYEMGNALVLLSGINNNSSEPSEPDKKKKK